MTGDDLIAQFESGATPAASFHHADHVRLAFEYLCRYPAIEALAKFSAALQRFACAQGKADRYHETITWAYLFLIHERMICSQAGSSPPVSRERVLHRVETSQSWDEFSAANLDLLSWDGSRGLLARYYRPETLTSDAARTTFLLPDRLAIPAQ